MSPSHPPFPAILDKVALNTDGYPHRIKLYPLITSHPLRKQSAFALSLDAVSPDVAK